MFGASGRRWSGICETSERPCGCDCCLLDPHYEAAGDYPAATGCGCNTSLCSCTGADVIELTYGPIVGTPVVTVSGAGFTAFQVIPPNRLIRTDSKAWPSCQTYVSGQGWVVTYKHGENPPELLKIATAQLASELLKSCANQTCTLPAGTVSVVKRGVTITLDPTQAGRSIPLIATALSAYPARMSMPDVRVPGKPRGLVTAGPAAPV
jgi:hypothetical protein